MIERLIEGCARNKLLVSVLALALALGGVYAARAISLDALPDLSDTQVILYASYPGQAPEVVEAQLTYPLTSRMLSVPGATDVRGFSFFGFSLVYVLFEDGTDLYWARSRVLESVSGLGAALPAAAHVELGPDATGVGWVYQYALTSERHTLQELRALQDWFLRFELASVQGVAEVASVGGFVKQYQVTVDPVKLRGYGVTLPQVRSAIERSNLDVGGRLIEMAETEFMVRGRGYLRGVADIEAVPVTVGPGGTPVLVRDLAHVGLGPELRRGLVELDGRGETVGGIVVMRFGENALAVTRRIEAKLDTLRDGLPEGVELVTVYDRSGLILGAVEYLRGKLGIEMAVVAAICFFFLLHLRSAFVAVLPLPLGILAAFLLLHAFGASANIMSLGGIAIAIGVMVDSSVVMVENAHKRLEQARESGAPFDRERVILDAAREVGPALFYSLLIVTVSFLPVFGLQAHEGRLFRPLALTKTFAMAAAAVIAVTVIPVLMVWLIRGRTRDERAHPLSRLVIALYRPCVRFVLHFPRSAVLLAVLLTAITVVPYQRIGREFLPPLYEGDFLWMPTTDPGISITKSKEILQQTNRRIAGFPEVMHTLGKIGRAETATDPAPLSMIETTIRLRPPSEWPRVPVPRFFSEWPAWIAGPLGKVWPETRPRRDPAELDRAINDAIDYPGLTPAGMEGPIKVRLDMLATGIRAPLGIKIAGPELPVLEELAAEAAALLEGLPGTRSVYPDRAFGGSYIDFEVERTAAARYGIHVADVQDVILSAIGGRNVTETVEGRERYPVNLRYPAELRDDPDKLGRVLVPTPSGEHVPLSQLATIRIRRGPPVVKSENGRPNAWVQVSIDERETDLSSYVERARRALDGHLSLPPGYSLRFAGRFEFLERARKRLGLLVPLTLGAIVVLLLLHFRNPVEALIVLLSIPFSLVGGVWLMYWLDYEMSVASAVGFIALAGLAAETGIVMLSYLDQAYGERVRTDRMRTPQDLFDAIEEGAALRVRPKLMTVATTILGLLPVMFGNSFESGSQVMQRIAAPMVGGLVSASILTLLILPAVYRLWRGSGIR